MIEILGAHRMRMQLEAGEVRHPGQRRGVARHDLLGACGRTESCSATTSIHGGPRLRRALLVEELAVDAVGIAHQHVRPAAGAAQRAVGDGEVVAHEIELGVTGLGKENLAGIADRDFCAVYDEDLLVGLGGHVSGPGSYHGVAAVGRRLLVQDFT